MPTPAEIEEQVQLERDQIRQGLKRLRDNTRRLEEKNYASASVYGIASIDSLLPLVDSLLQPDESLLQPDDSLLQPFDPLLQPLDS